MGSDIPFIRADLDKTSGAVAWYRLDKHMKDFIETCIKKHEGIDAIILTKEGDGISWNIGFSLQNPVRKEE